MPLTAQGANISLANGEVYFDRFTSAGAKTGERFLGNVTKLAISSTVETKEMFNSTVAASSLFASAVIRSTSELALNLTEYEAKNLALMLLGDDDEYTQGSTPVVDELLNGGVAVPSADAWYPVASRKITAVTVKVLAVTKVLGTDYQIDAETGRIYIIKGGTIVPGTDIVKVSYTPTAIAAGSGLPRVKAGTVGKIEGFLRFIGKPKTGPTLELQIFKVNLTPDGELNFISEEFGEYQLKGKVLADGVHTEPFQLLEVAQ